MRLSFQLTSIALVVACGTLHAGAILSAQFAGSYTETTFATGLDYPVGMTQLSDGSFLVGETSPPAGVTSGQFAFYNGAGRVVRFTDTVQAGVADNAGTVIASGLPGAVTGVLTLGNGLIAVSTIVNNSSGIFNYNAADITFLRTGAQPTDAYTNVGSVHFDYPAGGGAASLKPTVAATGSGQYTIYFGLNALGNDGTPGPNVQVSGLINGQLPAGSLNSLTVQTGGGTPNVTGLTNLATGIRNASSPIVDAAGNVYFGDNGYEDAGGKPISTDELDFFAAGTSGSVSYGFPGSYTAAGTGAFVGGLGIPPLAAFQPLPDGSNPVGIAAVALAPGNFPNQCVFAGFHGQYTAGGTSNLDDPVLCVNSDGTYAEFLAGGQSGLSHPDTLYSTTTSLFVANMFADNFVPGTGEIDVFTASVPEGATGLYCLFGLGLLMTASRRYARR